MNTNQPVSEIAECRQCGSCCRQGGPTLHKEDLPLLRAGHFARHHLVTIRAGEPAYDPLTDSTRPVEHELIKVSGRDSAWTCRFYDEESGACAIYQRRPLECRLLKCWDTGELKDIIGKSLLTRQDLLNPSDPLLNLLAIQEEKCDYKRINHLIDKLNTQPESSDSIEELTLIVRSDLSIRAYAQQHYSLSLDREIFLFGRPVFKVLASYGFTVHEENNQVFLRPPR